VLASIATLDSFLIYILSDLPFSTRGSLIGEAGVVADDAMRHPHDLQLVA
jgi:hypothetical protein